MKDIGRGYPWLAAGIPLLAVPAGVAISCRFVKVCDFWSILVYQWPSWLACYVPYWSFLYIFTKSGRPGAEQPGKGNPMVRMGLHGVNAVYAGVTLRFIATAGVLLYWKDVEIYKPILTFLSHLGCFFLFQLAAVSGIKK